MTTRIISPSALEYIWDSSKIFKLSYPQPTNATNFFPQYQHYDVGWADVSLVLMWTVLWGVLREVMMRGVFAPMMRNWQKRQAERKRLQEARRSQKKYSGSVTDDVLDVANTVASTKEKANGHDMRRRPSSNASSSPSPKRQQQQTPKSSSTVSKREAARQHKADEKNAVRFAEQGWSLTYYVVYWAYGLWIWYNSPWYPFNLDQLWSGFQESHMPIPAPMKFYYISQLAFWFNQLVVLNIEAPRKDHYRMLTHHIITTTLMIGSYASGFLRVGCIILFLLDFCDILLPFAKMCKYMNYPMLADAGFAAFLVGWIVTRVCLYNLVVISVIWDAPRLMRVDSSPDADLSTRAHYAFSALLSGLAILLGIWMLEICRVAWRVVSGKGADDPRSDDEE